MVTGAAAVAFERDAVFFWLYLLGVDWPFRLWSALGLPVGRRTDFYGWANPNGLGTTLIVVTDVIVWYVTSSLVAAAWRAPRRLPY